MKRRAFKKMIYIFLQNRCNVPNKSVAVKIYEEKGATIHQWRIYQSLQRPRMQTALHQDQAQETKANPMD
jgi:hypothetical protein